MEVYKMGIKKNISEDKTNKIIYILFVAAIISLLVGLIIFSIATHLDRKVDQDFIRKQPIFVPIQPTGPIRQVKLNPQAKRTAWGFFLFQV